MLNREPHLSDKKRQRVTDEELEKFYHKLYEYYDTLPYDVKKVSKSEIYYKVMASFFRFCSTIKGTKVLNADKVPNEKGMIFVSNHIGSFDQFIITSAIKGRALHYLVKNKVTTWPIRWNLIYKPTGVVVVDQESLSSWREAKEQLVQYLLHGTDIFIFPEGTRRGEDNLGEFSSGIAQLVQESQRPVTTLAIKNSAKILEHKKPIVCVGETLSFGSRDSIKLITKQIQDTVYSNYEQILSYEKTLKRR